MRELSASTVATELAEGRIVLIDVREPHEYSESRIKGAMNFPLSTFAPEALPAGGPRELVLHCGTGKRSGMALERCAMAGVGVHAHLEGGLTSWVDAGLPVLSVNPDTGEIAHG